MSQPKAYYNEHDPKAAAWLRELIKAGLIAPGEVDERSIEDVIPNELAGFTQCHFFAGIGVWSYALRCAGWPDDRPVWTGSCPCQPFSAAGKGAGIADERHLWPAFFWLIQQRQPAVLFGEQVASKDGLAWLDIVQSDLEAAEYAVAAFDLCAAGFGAPHIRQRLFFVADAANKRHERNGRTRRRRDGLENDGAACRLANTASGRGGAFGQGGNQGWTNCSSGCNGESCSLANPLPTGRAEGWPKSGNGQTAGSGGFSGLAIANGNSHWTNGHRSKGETIGISAVNRAEESRAGESGRAGDSLCAVVQSEREGLEGLAGNGDDGNESRWHGANETRSIAAPSATNGFWANAEWLYCRDEKYRPTQPGIFPLAHGTAARVGRLRGFGNAIVAPVAEEFIKAYLETK